MVKSSVLINKNIFAQRFLGWFFINMLIAFMINNILNLAYKIPFAIEIITKNELLSFYKILEKSLDRTNFFNVKERKKITFQKIKNIFCKYKLSSEEVRTLISIFKKIG